MSLSTRDENRTIATTPDKQENKMQLSLLDTKMGVLRAVNDESKIKRRTGGPKAISQKIKLKRIDDNSL